MDAAQGPQGVNYADEKHLPRRNVRTADRSARRAARRGASEAERSFGGASLTRSSLWTDIGFGFEQRQDTLDVSVVGCIVFTTSSLTPQWAIHGGVGFGF